MKVLSFKYHILTGFTGYFLLSCLSALAIYPGLPDHRPLGEGENITYSLNDLDDIRVVGTEFADTRYGNFLSFDNVAYLTFEEDADLSFNNLTGIHFRSDSDYHDWFTRGSRQLDPFSSFKNDLFVLRIGSYFNLLFDVTTEWSSNKLVIKNVRGRALLNPSILFELYRYFHFRNKLQNEIDRQQIGRDSRKAIVVIHGWNRTSNDDSYDTSDNTWELLKNNLITIPSHRGEASFVTH